MVLLGDSITQGWGEDFSAWFPGMKIANRGISGDTSRGVLIRLKEDVLALDPQSVVLLIGTNDLEGKADPETVAANLKLILAELARGKMPIVLCQVFPSSASKSRPADKIKKVNQLYADVVKGKAQVTLVETWPLFADAKGDPPGGGAFRPRRRCSLLTDRGRVCASLAPRLGQKNPSPQTWLYL